MWALCGLIYVVLLETYYSSGTWHGLYLRMDKSQKKEKRVTMRLD